MSPNRHPDPRVSVVLLGLATTIAQALLLREAMAAMGGSEIAWGTVMALWLFGMGFGARVGVGLGRGTLARLSPALVIALAGAGVMLFRAAPALTGAAAGESITTASAAWLWVAAVVPAAFAGGLAFPFLAGEIGGSGGGRAYALEAVGALAGGLLVSLILVTLGAAAALTLSFGAVVATSLWRRSRFLATIIALAGALAALPSGKILERAGWRWADHPGQLHAWRETRLQRLEATTGPPVSVYADGRLLATYPDPYTVLPRAHLVMLIHPDPKRVFAVGAAADGSVEAMVQHVDDELVLVEEDPTLLKLLPAWYGPHMAAALANPRVRPVVSDPLRALAGSTPFDLVLLFDTDPTTLRRNRTRTLEFLRTCRRHMSPSGILVMRVGIPDTYLGGAGGRLLAVLAATVSKVFPQVKPIPGEEILLVAGGPRAQITLDPEALAARLADRPLHDAAAIPEMLPLLLDTERARDLAAAIPEGAPLNTIESPRAVLLAGGIHEAHSRPSLVRLLLLLESTGPWPLAAALGLVVLALVGSTSSRKRPGASTAAVVGFCSMGWWLLLIASWQATRGSVYSEVGALTAAFMAGLAAGAAGASRWRSPSHRLPALLCAGVLLSLVLTAGTAVRFPLVAVPLLLAAGGVLTGAAFPGTAELTAHSRLRRGAGIAFAADEAGAAFAALILGILSIPWAGMATTALGLAVLELAAIPAVVIAIRRRQANS